MVVRIGFDKWLGDGIHCCESVAVILFKEIFAMMNVFWDSICCCLSVRNNICFEKWVGEDISGG